MVKTAAPNLVEQIKMIASNATVASKPCNWLYGTVISVDPLQIQIQPTLILTASFLVLSNRVKDHYVDMTVSMQTENDAFMNPTHTHPYEDTQPNGTPASKMTQPTADLDVTHKHEIKHKIKVLQHYGLKINEKVILLQMTGGKQFYVLDRVDPPITQGEFL